MKHKLSITIDEKLVKSVKELVESGRFRNKSHIMEYSLMKFIKENER